MIASCHFLRLLLIPVSVVNIAGSSVCAQAASGPPVPSPRPSPATDGKKRQIPLSVPVPIPSPRPEKQARETREPAELPKAERACRAELTALGVGFAPQDPIEADGGCHIAHPIVIEKLSAIVTLQPEALVNCVTALALARFFTADAQEIADRHFQQEIDSVRHASAYVCRPRNGTGTLSEHAYGNALDIAAFTLSNGKTVDVRAYADAKGPEAGFISDMRKAACGPFRTVLGPGSDADHADHFHFDMKARRNSSTYCK